jgi:hypothetical protein
VIYQEHSSWLAEECRTVIGMQLAFQIPYGGHGMRFCWLACFYLVGSYSDLYTKEQTDAAESLAYQTSQFHYKPLELMNMTAANEGLHGLLCDYLDAEHDISAIVIDSYDPIHDRSGCIDTSPDVCCSIRLVVTLGFVFCEVAMVENANCQFMPTPHNLPFRTLYSDGVAPKHDISMILS